MPALTLRSPTKDTVPVVSLRLSVGVARESLKVTPLDWEIETEEETVKPEVKVKLEVEELIISVL